MFDLSVHYYFSFRCLLFAILFLVVDMGMYNAVPIITIPVAARRPAEVGRTLPAGAEPTEGPVDRAALEAEAVRWGPSGARLEAEALSGAPPAPCFRSEAAGSAGPGLKASRSSARLCPAGAEHVPSRVMFELSHRRALGLRAEGSSNPRELP